MLAQHHSVRDIAQHMLHFLENHDEQRLASKDFVGDMNKAKSAMVVSHLVSNSPTLIYFGQEVGEAGNESAGFGSPTRTSIFDYIGVPEFQKWVNNGQFDGGGLSKSQKELREFYKSLLPLARRDAIINGELIDLSSRVGSEEKVVSFVRESASDKLYVFANFSDHTKTIALPMNDVKAMTSLIKYSGSNQVTLQNNKLTVTLSPFAAVVLTAE